MAGFLTDLRRFLARGRIARLQMERLRVRENLSIAKKNHQVRNHLYARLRKINAELMRLGA